MIKHSILSLVLACISLTITLNAQKRSLNPDTLIQSKGSAMINGVRINYTAETGTQPVFGKDDSAIAYLHYTYYTKDNVNNKAKRPLLISFNGGPGSASVWMHIAYTGPKLLNLDDEGFPIMPYGTKDNPHSVLDVADIVYVNPVNTGYSRILNDAKREQFFGINADINYLAEWLSNFLQRKDRWLSPKFLIGESYGGTRVSGLAHELQSKHWAYLNGVILVSPADYNTFTSDALLSKALFLPYYTATAWYHNRLDKSYQEKSLEDLLPEVEDFTINKLIPAIAKGASISDSEKQDIASAISKYSGIKTQYIIDYHLQMPSSFFWKKLLESTEKPFTVGRLDSRYKGLDLTENGTSPDYNAELTSWLHSFTPAINHYLKNTLGLDTDLKYNVFGNVHPWDRTNNNTRENLRKAMAINPMLNVMYQVGLYDGATSYFHSKYSMWQTDPSGNLKDRFTFKTYPSGHMMYLRKEDLKRANDDLRNFINESVNYGKPAKY